MYDQTRKVSFAKQFSFPEVFEYHCKKKRGGGRCWGLVETTHHIIKFNDSTRFFTFGVSDKQSWTYRRLSSDFTSCQHERTTLVIVALHSTCLPASSQQFIQNTHCGNFKRAVCARVLPLLRCVYINENQVSTLGEYKPILYLSLLKIATQQREHSWQTLLWTLIAYIPPRSPVTSPGALRIYFCPNLSSNIATPTLRHGTSPGTQHHLLLRHSTRIG